MNIVIVEWLVWLMMTHFTYYQMEHLINLNKPKNIVGQDD
jgi:hypothetical protein